MFHCIKQRFFQPNRLEFSTQKNNQKLIHGRENLIEKLFCGKCGNETKKKKKKESWLKSDKSGSMSEWVRDVSSFSFHRPFNHIQLWSAINSPSSTHISPSSISFKPVGQAHDIRGLLSVTFGAGKHRCEQCPFTAWQKFSPSGCRYGWYTWIVIGCWSCSERKGKIN